MTKDRQTITKDSGTRREFDTGSVRDAAVGKGRYDLVSPLALLRLAQLYERGAVKYECRNWEKGQPQSVYLDCAVRHLQKYLAGYRDEDHLAASAWNVFAMMHQEHQLERGLLPASLDDLPNYLTQSEVSSGDNVPIDAIRSLVNVEKSKMPTRPPNESMQTKPVEIDVALRALNVGAIFYIKDSAYNFKCKVVSHDPVFDRVEYRLQSNDKCGWDEPTIWRTASTRVTGLPEDKS